MAFSKIILNGTTLMDATTATASVDDIIAPKTAMLADGEMTTGTGSLGYTAADWLDLTKPSGNIISSVEPTHYSHYYILRGRTNIQTLFLTEATTIADSMLAYAKVRIIVGPKVTTAYSTAMGFNTDLEKIDVIGCFANSVSIVRGCTKLNLIILRATSINALNNINSFIDTPFASGKAGGTIYIPKVLYDELGTGSSLDYKAATNWSTIDGYGTITWACIEGSAYETQYVDETPIEET